MEPLISVIVPVYKVEQYLDECVQSIINQTYKNLEIILVDDGSPDRCPEMCDEYARQDSRIKVIHKENGGLSSARNAGLDVATGEYIGFVDSDDFIDKEMYEKLLNAFKGGEAIFAAKCNHIRFANGQFIPQKWWPNKIDCILPPEKFLLSIVSDNVSHIVWDMLIQRKNMYVRFAEGKSNEDLLFNYHLGYYVEKHNLSLRLLTEELYFYRDIEGSISNGNKFILSVIKNLVYMYQDALQKGKQDIANILYAKTASRLYELNMLMVTNESLRQQFYCEYHKKLFDFDWKGLRKNWGLRHRIGLFLLLYCPRLLSLSCLRSFVTKKGIAPPWK